MQEVNKDVLPLAPCCPGSALSESGPDVSGASCGCGSAPGRRSRIKALIAAIVLLAAVGVGAYSLLAEGAAEKPIAAAAAVNPGASAAANGTGPVAPAQDAQPACCGHAAGVEAAPQPPCCGGGGGAASPAALPGENPNCGKDPKPCCNH